MGTLRTNIVVGDPDLPGLLIEERVEIELLKGARVLVTAYGARDDAVYRVGSTTAGSAVVTTTAATFTDTATDAGKLVAIADAVAAGTHFLGKVLSVQSATQATLTANVPLTVAGKEVVFGTDNWAAVEAAMTALTGLGRPSTLVYPDKGPGGQGCYLFSKAIRPKPNVSHEAASARRVQLVNRWSGGTNVHPAEKAMFIPGFVHGGALWTTTNETGHPNPGATKMPHYDAAPVSLGSVTVTGATAGQVAANFPVGAYVGVRSKAAHTQQTASAGVYDEMPYQLYFARVTAVSGDVVTLSRPSPYAIASASIFKVDGTATSNGVFFAGDANFPAHGLNGAEPMWMTSNVTIDGFTIDAADALFGGGVIGFTWRNCRPVSGKAWGSVVSLNSLCDALVEGIDASWTFAVAEIKLGSGNVLMQNCRCPWSPGGAVAYDPVAMGESAHGVFIRHNDITLPRSFDQAGRAFVSFRNGQDLYVEDNDLRCDAVNLDCVAGWYDSDEHAMDVVERSSFSRNRVYTYGGATDGVARLIRLAIGTSTAYGPSGVDILDNKFMGAVKASSNEWLRVGIVKGGRIAGNVVPPGTIVLNTRGSGYDLIADFTVRPHTAGEGLVTPVMTVGTTITQAATSAAPRKFGVLGGGSIVRSVLVEVLTAFDGTSPTITVGHDATPGAYLTGVPVGVVGATEYRPGNVGSATAGQFLGRGLTGTGTVTRLVQTYYTGSGATTGKVRVTVDYMPWSAAS